MNVFVHGAAGKESIVPFSISSVLPFLLESSDTVLPEERTSTSAQQNDIIGILEKHQFQNSMLSAEKRGYEALKAYQWSWLAIHITVGLKIQRLRN